MVIDTVEHIGRYRGLSKGLDVLIDWMGAHDYRELAVGRHDILGDKVFANVMDATTRCEADAHYEWHKRYWDVQVDVSGREAFCVTEGETVEVEAYDEGKDFALCDVINEATVIRGDLDAGRFVIYLDNEPHMPNCAFAGDGVRTIKKICFKVIVDDLFDE